MNQMVTDDKSKKVFGSKIPRRRRRRICDGIARKVFDERVEDWHIDRTHHFPLYCAAFWLSSDDWQSVDPGSSQSAKPVLVALLASSFTSVYTHPMWGGGRWWWVVNRRESKGGDDRGGG